MVEFGNGKSKIPVAKRQSCQSDEAASLAVKRMKYVSKNPYFYFIFIGFVYKEISSQMSNNNPDELIQR